MKSTRLLAAAGLSAVLIYSGCQKSAHLDSSAGPYTPQMTTATISGRVTDENKLPVSGAIVKAGTGADTTDVNGQFIIKNVSVDKNAGAVKVEKDSFFTGVKTIVVDAGKDNNVSVKLLRKTVAGTFTAANGGKVTMSSSGASFTFQANAVVNAATNAAYTGTVTTSAYFFNPAASDFEEIIPGALRGIDSANRETGLQSFSMLAVELSGANGEKLQLASGKPASIVFPIPAALRAQAPATIPLWYLDETVGLWKQEGTAVREGNNYIGSVKHFSYWNCDAPYQLVDFSATVKTQQGVALAGGKVVIKATGTDSTVVFGSGDINESGYTGGKIPAGRTLKMVIYDKCGNILSNQNIGPFTAATDMGTVTVNYAGVAVTFTGTVVNCNGAVVTNGYVTVNLDGLYYRADVVNGAFVLVVNRCVNTSTNASFTAYDVAALQGGTAVSVAVSGSTVTVGQLTACGTSMNQYIDYTVDTSKVSLNNLSDSLTTYIRINGTDTVTNIYGMRKDGSNYFMFSFNGGSKIGTKTLQYATISYKNSYLYSNSANPLTLNVTEYGSYISGNFSGNIKDSGTNVTYPLTCNFRVKK